MGGSHKKHWDGDCVVHCTYLFAEDEANTSQEPRTEIRSEKSSRISYEPPDTFKDPRVEEIIHEEYVPVIISD